MNTATQTTEVKKEAIKLPAHLQAIVDKVNAMNAKFTITDVTPAGYGPDSE